MSDHDLDEEATDPSAFLLSSPNSEGNFKRDDEHTSPRASRYLPLSSKRLALLLFVVTYLLAILFLRSYSARDPTSVFFNESLGYAARYSAIRAAQADALIAGVNNGSVTVPRPHNAQPQLCVAVPTVARPGHQYVSDAVGSILEGLSATERQKLFLGLFIAHTTPESHPIYNETWTHSLPDQVYSYGSSGNLGVNRSQIERWEEAHAYIPKGLFDYAIALDTCAATGAPLVAVLEGDVLAARGWLQRALQAGSATVPALEHNSESKSEKWLYLRLFYTETYLGWNSEFWTTYLGWSVLVWIAVLTPLLVLRWRGQHGGSARRSMSAVFLSIPTVAFISCGVVPLSIVLVFLAGRMIVWPLSTGVIRMDNFGCCSQALVFPRVHVPMLIDELRANWVASSREILDGRPTPHIPYVDMLMEHVAASRGLARYAAVPALFQHAGTTSSKGDPIADARARMIWNFAFENLDAERGVADIG